MHISKRIFQNIIKIANYQTFSKVAVKHPPTHPFTCKPLEVPDNMRVQSKMKNEPFYQLICFFFPTQRIYQEKFVGKKVNFWEANCFFPRISKVAGKKALFFILAKKFIYGR